MLLQTPRTAAITARTPFSMLLQTPHDTIAAITARMPFPVFARFLHTSKSVRALVRDVFDARVRLAYEQSGQVLDDVLTSIARMPPYTDFVETGGGMYIHSRPDRRVLSLSNVFANEKEWIVDVHQAEGVPVLRMDFRMTPSYMGCTHDTRMTDVRRKVTVVVESARAGVCRTERYTTPYADGLVHALVVTGMVMDAYSE